MRCEVAIVGAGPAGSACALRLARLGVDVCLVEQSRFPRTKACGEYLNAASISCLERLGVASTLRDHAHVLHGIRLFGRAGSAQLRFAGPGWSLSRATLDAALLDAAVDAGATHVTAHVERCIRTLPGMQLVVRESSGETRHIDADVVIGADGIHSVIAREMKLRLPAKRSGQRFAIGGHYTGVRGLDGHVEMFVDGPAYFAVNPLDTDAANVMLVVPEEELRRARDDVEGFFRERVARLTGGRAGFERAVLDGKRMAIGPLWHRARRYCAPGVLLAGDAAHFLDPFTGQGVFLALRSAELAARAASARVANLSPERLAWRGYEGALRREIAHRRRLASLVSLLVRSQLVSRAAARLVHAYPKFFTPVLDAVTGTA